MLTKLFPLFVRRFTRHTNRFFQNHVAAGKGQRDLKTIPTVGPKLGGEVIGKRDNGQPGHLRQRHDPFLHDITGTAWTIRSNGQIIAALGPGG